MAICTMWFVVARPPWNTAMITWAATASTPMTPVTKGPANAAAIAGAMTSVGPR
ncbi:hypothetical protein ACGF4C_26395 [Streptomyces sp. NPDC048197]|uniref:hypothetical protein n=1 Tax=Streptomyces sp. NPDC048197 TaxID=3365511 RepID=UPI00371F9C01